ncbi:hypothetical protein J3R82DRAFT_975 [Butyriboletus roseoflavus]|nr:hypothetical protein J3R82DRAFT_975 [Butyriboletus roseoflavus]
MDAKEHLDKANELKREGNGLFKATKWNEALVSYRTALSQLPPAKPELDQADIDSPGSRQRSPSVEPSAAAVTDNPNTVDSECAKARAVLYANIGRLQRSGRRVFSRQVHSPGIVMNALNSRLQLSVMTHTMSRHFNEGQHRMRRLVHGHPSPALKKVRFSGEVELLPPGSPELTQTRKVLQSLEPRTRAAQEKETAEMMDKLKGLGNTVLGMPVFHEINSPRHNGLLPR